MAKACNHMATTAHNTAWADVYRPLCVHLTGIIAASRHQRNLVKSIIRKEYIAELLAFAVNACKGMPTSGVRVQTKYPFNSLYNAGE